MKPNWKQFINQHIPAPNLSQAYHRTLIEYMKHYGVGDSILLVGEPEACKSVFYNHFGNVTVDVLSYSGERGENYINDLNILTDFDKTYSTVFSQAVLEHVCRPSIYVENLSRLTKTGGHIVLMSVGPKFGYHRFPIDCVRFFKDFYEDLQRYIPIKLCEFEQDELDCQFVLYERS